MSDIDFSYASKQIPLILECPFLATTNTTINCRSVVTDISVINMRAKLKIFKAFAQLVFEDEYKCFFVDVIDEMIEEALPAILNSDPLGTCLSYGDLRLFDLRGTIDEVDSNLDSTPHFKSSSWAVSYTHLTLPTKRIV